jgi:hemerythrin superfamily protein
MELISALKKDHQAIKKLYTSGLHKKTTFEAKKKLFKKLSLLVPAHSKSEEIALYSNVTDLSKLRHFAYEGFEEHSLIDHLLRDLKNFSEHHVWEAKFTIVCEILKHHIEEEEKEFFPKLTKMLSLDVRKDLGEEYSSRFSEFIKGPRNEPESLYIPSHAAH